MESPGSLTFDVQGCACPDEVIRGAGSKACWFRPERTAEPLPRGSPMFRISAGLEDAGDLRAGFERLRAN